jgi:hypothetical protein
MVMLQMALVLMSSNELDRVRLSGLHVDSDGIIINIEGEMHKGLGKFVSCKIFELVRLNFSNTFISELTALLTLLL